MEKHAYLIIAHNDFYTLEKLLKLIDDERNDIYIHIDKKVQNFDFDYFKKIITKSKIFFTNRIDVRWGDPTQIECELILLKEASKLNYSYYHLLSGVDLPLKSQDYIHNFFEQNKGIELLEVSNEVFNSERRDRYTYYWFMKNYRVKNKLLSFVTKCFNYSFLILQKLLFIRRNKKSYKEFKFGSQWFSVTDDFIKYILSQENKIRKVYNHSSCCDEIFLQTALYNSKFKEKLLYLENNKSTNGRFIDWERGKPYTFKLEDKDLLLNSDYLFARKFNSNEDKEIIDYIYNNLKGEN